MKYLKAIAILLFGPLLGIVLAFILGALAVPPDPNFPASGGHASPGDGFGIMGLISLSLLISVPVSVFLAAVILFRKPKAQNQIETP
jgi:hypothetical protein